MLSPIVESGRRDPWNKRKLVGRKAPLKLREIWAIRVRLELGDRKRELALFNLAIDSKLRGCDLMPEGIRSGSGGPSEANLDAPRLVGWLVEGSLC